MNNDLLEVSKHLLAGILADGGRPDERIAAQHAVKYAKALMEEVRREGGTEEPGVQYYVSHAKPELVVRIKDGKVYAKWSRDPDDEFTKQPMSPSEVSTRDYREITREEAFALCGGALK